MSEQTREPEAQEEDGVVLEDNEEDRARMEELDKRIESEGIQGGEPDDATRGGFGTPQTMVAGPGSISDTGKRARTTRSSPAGSAPSRATRMAASATRGATRSSPTA